LVSLGLGLVLLPVGFIAFNHVLLTLVETVPSVLLLVFVGIEIWRWRQSRVTEPQLRVTEDKTAAPVPWPANVMPTPFNDRDILGRPPT
jgi:hypothetical protein